MTQSEALWAVLVIAAVTALIRFAPFFITGRKEMPGWLLSLGKVLPPAVMGMLVVYCLKDIRFDILSGWLPHAAGCAIVVGSYLWKKNTLLSILLGTALYMVLLQGGI